MASHSAPDQQNEQYLLARHFTASARLTGLHNLLTKRQGYLLHPKIISSLGLDNDASSVSSPVIHVLDLAAGNCVWATDVARSLRSSNRNVDITCLDISSAMFPPPQSRLPNMSFGTWSIFDTVKEEYIGRFDIINIRLIIALLFQDINRRHVVISNVKKMLLQSSIPARLKSGSVAVILLFGSLYVARSAIITDKQLKPGGWLQWADSPPPNFGELKVHPDRTCEISTETPYPLLAIEKHFPFSKATMFLYELDKLIGNSGFEDVEAHWVPVILEMAKYEADYFALTVQEMQQTVVKLPHVNGDDARVMYEALDQYMTEIDRGEKLVGGRMLVVVGRMS